MSLVGPPYVDSGCWGGCTPVGWVGVGERTRTIYDNLYKLSSVLFLDFGWYQHNI